jgi:hypothetical protein
MKRCIAREPGTASSVPSSERPNMTWRRCILSIVSAPRTCLPRSAEWYTGSIRAARRSQGTIASIRSRKASRLVFFLCPCGSRSPKLIWPSMLPPGMHRMYAPVILYPQVDGHFLSPCRASAPGAAARRAMPPGAPPGAAGLTWGSFINHRFPRSIFHGPRASLTHHRHRRRRCSRTLLSANGDASSSPWVEPTCQGAPWAASVSPGTTASASPWPWTSAIACAARSRR